MGPREARGRGATVSVLSLAALLLAGVVGCHGPGRLQEWTLELESLATVGSEADDPAALFYEPAALGFDAAGRLHVLDSGNHRVQIFGADGRLEATLGRQGAGPGDLYRPEGMWVFPDGEVVVADTGNRRRQRFGPAGQALEPVPLDYMPLDVVGSPRNLWVLRLPSPTFVLGPESEPLVRKLDRDGVEIDAYVRPRPAKVGLLYFLLNTLRLAPGPEGGFALAESHVASRIRTYEPSGKERDELPVLYKAEGWAPLGRLPEMVNDASLARIARTCTDLAWDDRRGLYWVLAGYVDRSGEDEWISATELYRYEPGGRYRGSIMLPFAARAVAPAPDGAIWLLDLEGVAHRMRLRDPDSTPAAGLEPGSPATPKAPR